MRNSYKILVGKPEGKRPLERFRHRCGSDIKLDVRERRCEVVDRIRLVVGRV